VKTRFQTRAFFLCFVPFAVLLAGTFWTIQSLVQLTIRGGLRTSVRNSQAEMAKIYARSELENNRFLKVAGENTSLKAGIELLLAHPHNIDARSTVEDQLRELGERMGFDFMLVSSTAGTPIAAVMREAHSRSGPGELVPLDVSLLKSGHAGFLVLGGQTFQMGSVPVDENQDNIGELSVGERLDFSGLPTAEVLVHSSKVVESNIPNVPADELEKALADCPSDAECDVRFHAANWISLPVQVYADGYRLLSLANVDDAWGPIHVKLRNVFLTLVLACVLVALPCSVAMSTSIVKPLAAVVSHLRKAARTGALGELESRSSSINEIRELIEIYNRAALSVRASGEHLQAAYVQFVGSLASALDARDPYTAGHSWRVSQLSCAVAAALGFEEPDVERIRFGALLHDIGKIGIADSVLQKPGRLTDEEFARVQEHPVMGRRILEGVEGFVPFLPAVELHHENWDGSGYPNGEKGEETPIDARIIHVADAYDAMTSDRSYRSGMTHEAAMSELKENAGIQFDPAIVAAFVGLGRERLAREVSVANTAAQGVRMAEAGIE
jgi:HD-GYP domain-containing protein (c-di-GMP phosphodiesterase class II)